MWARVQIVAEILVSERVAEGGVRVEYRHRLESARNVEANDIASSLTRPLSECIVTVFAWYGWKNS